MNPCQEIVVPPMSAKAFHVSAGQLVRIVDTQGQQPGDLVAFSAEDLAVRFSQSRTRVENRKIALTQGDALWTDTQPPQVMLRIIDDTFGCHDLLYTPCCRYAMEKRFNVSRDGCLENLAHALQPWGLTEGDVPDPLNLFFRVSVNNGGDMTLHPPTSEPASAIDLQAEMDCLVAVSTCSVPIPNADNSEYHITILDAASS